MDLGRHFPVDVVGGLLVGGVGLSLARLALPAADAGTIRVTAGARTALVLSIAVVAIAPLFAAGLNAHEAGRFSGLVAAVLMLARWPSLDDSGAPWKRLAGMAGALVLLGAALWSITWTIANGPVSAALGTMAASAALHASVLLVPARLLGSDRSSRGPTTHRSQPS
jgi:hypothetical protein